jgi:hypothetical protein
VLFLVALGFLAVLAYGTVALGAAHVAFEPKMAAAGRCWIL